MSIEAMSLVEAAKQALEALELVVTLEWHPAFTRKEYDSDEPEENELRERVLTAITALRTAIEEAEKQERNFCERCGKRLGGAEHIHTCTPPTKE